MAVQALALAALVALGHVQYWHVLIMATIYGLANTLDIPARQAFVAEMVGKESLVSAIALNSAVFNGGPRGRAGGGRAGHRALGNRDGLRGERGLVRRGRSPR